MQGRAGAERALPPLRRAQARDGRHVLAVAGEGGCDDAALQLGGPAAAAEGYRPQRPGETHPSSKRRADAFVALQSRLFRSF